MPRTPESLRTQLKTSAAHNPMWNHNLLFLHFGISMNETNKIYECVNNEIFFFWSQMSLFAVLS